MSMDPRERRAFLRAMATMGAAWASADLLHVESALAWASTQATRAGASVQNAASTALSSAQLATLDAVADRILPAVDGRPGARALGVRLFIDRALATFNSAQKPAYVEGIADLDRRASGRKPGARFIELDSAQQDAVLRDIEATAFFAAVRVDTLVGAFALPSWGGNANFAGWQLLGFEHQPRFQAPFGAYDAEVANATTGRRP